MAKKKDPTPAAAPATTASARFEPARWFGGDPFKTLHEEMDRLFHAFSAPQAAWSGAMWPRDGAMGLRVDIAESDDQITVKADLPGVPEEDVHVTLEDDVLRIEAEKKSEAEKSEETWRVVERSYGRYERSIRVPDGVDPDKISAKFDKGVLTITLPKPPAAKSKSRRISVQKAG